MAKKKQETAKVSDLIEDDLNANKGSERGMELLAQSVDRFGAGRSILLDKNKRIIAGNKTKRTAQDAGIDDVIIVKSNGKQLIAVMREDIDLDTVEGRSMAIADNRVSEKNLVWDVENIEEIEERFGVDLAEHWNEAELRALMDSLHDEPNAKSGGLGGGGSNGIRQMVLYYNEDQHHEVLTDLEEIGKAFGIEDDNTETILKLIEFYDKNKHVEQ